MPCAVMDYSLRVDGLVQQILTVSDLDWGGFVSGGPITLVLMGLARGDEY